MESQWGFLFYNIIFFHILNLNHHASIDGCPFSLILSASLGPPKSNHHILSYRSSLSDGCPLDVHEKHETMAKTGRHVAASPSGRTT